MSEMIQKQIQMRREQARGYEDGIANHQAWELALILDKDADTMEGLLAENDRLLALIADAKARFDDIAGIVAKEGEER